MKIAHYGEDRLVAELTRGLARVGDDCAVLGGPRAREWRLLKTDAILEGVHFLPDADPSRIGWKALARAISDIAAMGGEPREALITIALPPEREVAWAKAIYAGLRKCARRFSVEIVGGETARSPGPLFISVALTGVVERARCVRRGGGRAGDLLYVTGRLGGSLAGKHFDFIPRLAEARWLTEHFKLRAMMDLSDGLGSDLPRLARASNLSFSLDENALPLTAGSTPAQAISDGEDYELLFAIAPREATKLEPAWRVKFPRLPLTRVGLLNPKSKIQIEPTASAPAPSSSPKSVAGYDHFAPR